jgi:hypothetical protein
MAPTRLPRVIRGLVVAVLVASQSGTTVAAVEATDGPVYGGTVAWTTPALTVEGPTGDGFVGVTEFHGAFVAVERNAVASTSVDGITWLGHALPGSGGEKAAVIAAGPTRVVIIGQDVAWTSPDATAWTAAAAPPPGPAQPTAMTALDHGFVAVGVAPGGRRAAAWFSADGSSWTASPDQPAFDQFCPTAVAATSTGRVVAVGDDCYQYLARPAAAISDDGGLTWRRAPRQTQLSEEGRLSDVVAGGPGFIAVGSVIRDVYPGWPPATGIFVSADGLAWRRVALFGGTIRTGAFIVAIPGGYLAVATNTEGKSSAFVSIDALRWTRSTSLPATPGAFNDDFYDAFHGLAVNGTSMVGVGTSDLIGFVDVPKPGALVIVGELTPGPNTTGPIPVPPVVPTPRPRAVPAQPTFPGTVKWTVAALPVNPPPGGVLLGSHVTDVTRWRGGFAAVGSASFDASPHGRGVVWTSPDGTRWAEHPLPTACSNAPAIAASRTSIVIAGDAGICRSTDGVTWSRATDTPHSIRGFSEVIAGGPGFLLTMSYATSRSISVKVWRSVDGLHWKTAGHPGVFSNLTPLLIGDGPRGIVILGRPYPSGRGYEPTVRPLRSQDGVAWSSGATQRAFEPLAFDSGRASIVRGGPGYIAAGSYQPRSRIGAAVWTSGDGLTWRRVHFMLPASGYVEVGGLARIGPGYAVVGLVAPPSQVDPAVPTVWLSPDGSRWRSGVGLPFPTDAPAQWVEIFGVAGGSARLVAVGDRSELGGRRTAQVWTGAYQAP